MGHFFLPVYQMLNTSHLLPARTGCAGRLATSPRNGQRNRNTERASGRALRKAAGRFLAGLPGSKERLVTAAGGGVGAEHLVKFLTGYRLA